MATWQRFCKNKIEKIEKVWNRKLDERHKDSDDEGGSNDKDEDDDHDEFEANMRRIDEQEKNISDILANIPNRRRENVMRAQSVSFIEKSEPDKDLTDTVQAALAEVRAKDDSDIKKREEDKFNQNQYWKVPDQYDLDELLAEQGEDEKHASNYPVDGSEHDKDDPMSPLFAVNATANVDEDFKEDEEMEVMMEDQGYQQPDSPMPGLEANDDEETKDQVAETKTSE